MRKIIFGTLLVAGAIANAGGSDYGNAGGGLTGISTLLGTYTLNVDQAETFHCPTKIILGVSANPNTVSKYVENSKGYHASIDLPSVNQGPRTISRYQFPRLKSRLQGAKDIFVRDVTFDSDKSRIAFEEVGWKTRFGIETEKERFVESLELTDNVLTVQQQNGKVDGEMVVTSSCTYTKGE